MSAPIAIHPETLDADGMPLLVVRPDADAVGTVIWYHGFGAEKEANLKELRQLAGSGLIAVGVDVVGHGRRSANDLEERKAGTQAEALSSVIEFATATALELPMLLDYLRKHDLAAADRVSIVGVSMGAFVVYRALADRPKLHRAVALLGSPEWPADDSPHRAGDWFRSVPLLSITAERDVNVPPAPARRLHQHIDYSYPGTTHRYVEIEAADHLMDDQHWATAMRHMMKWLLHGG